MTLSWMFKVSKGQYHEATSTGWAFREHLLKQNSGRELWRRIRCKSTQAVSLGENIVAVKVIIERSQAWWHMPLILALGKQGQADL